MLRRWSCAFGWPILLAIVSNLSLCGCRALRPHSHAKELSSARQLSLRGADSLQQEKIDEAEAFFSEALRHSDSDERAHWGFAEVLWQKKQFADATKHMAKSAELSGGNPDLRVRLGQMYLEQNSFELAAQQADAALQNNRDHPDAWVLQADVLRRQGKLEEALEQYHRALAYQQNCAVAQIAVAELYRELGRPQRALATLERLSDRCRECDVPPRAWLLKAKSLADLGAQQEALACLRQATNYAAGDQVQLLVDVARVQYQLSDLVESRISLGRALRNDPQNRQALALQSELDQSFIRLAAGADAEKSWNY